MVYFWGKYPASTHRLGRIRQEQVSKKELFRPVSPRLDIPAHLCYNAFIKIPTRKEGIRGITGKNGKNIGKETVTMDTIWKTMFDAARSVMCERRISEYVSAGEVGAAILSKSGTIYTGVCVDTCSTLGICAERNAIFNMITNGEQEIDKVLAVMPDGHTGAPCGACRELMVQLMPDSYRDIEIMLDYENNKIVTLGELTPEWWI